jgi:hypothetical protein
MGIGKRLVIRGTNLKECNICDGQLQDSTRMLGRVSSITAGKVGVSVTMQCVGNSDAGSPAGISALHQLLHVMYVTGMLNFWD